MACDFCPAKEIISTGMCNRLISILRLECLKSSGVVIWNMLMSHCI